MTLNRRWYLEDIVFKSIKIELFVESRGFWLSLRNMYGAGSMIKFSWIDFWISDLYSKVFLVKGSIEIQDENIPERKLFAEKTNLTSFN